MEESNKKYSLGRDPLIRNLKMVFRKNNYVSVFFTMSIIFLLVALVGILNLNLGNNIISNTISLFSYGIYLFLFVMVAISGILAYFEKYSWMWIPILLWILFIAIFIRTSNIDGLKDVTTGDWTLGPDLDPFLYLRHAQEISEGRLENPDMMRYVPLGTENYALKSLMPWAILIIFSITKIFGEQSLTHAAIIAPVIFFIISTFGFFLFNQSVFSLKFSKKLATSIAILASLIYIFLPQMLPRTIAGVPEIESLGMVFFWFAFFFFILAWKQKNPKKIILFGILAGIFTGAMSWTWGGYRYIYMAISLTAFILFLFEKERKKNFLVFSSWIVVALILELIKEGSISTVIFRLTDTGPSLFILFVFFVDIILFKTNIKDKLKIKNLKIPERLISIILALLLLIISLLIISPNFLINSFSGIFNGLLRPFGEERVGLTVAENKAPYLVDVLESFKKLFWVFLAGVIILFWDCIKGINRKKKILFTLFFILLICGLTFSGFSSSSLLNGNNFISKLFYFGGIFIFVIAILYFYIKSKKEEDEETINGLKNICVGEVLILSLSFFALISIRGAIRLFFIVSPIIAIVSSFVPFRFISLLSKKNKEDIQKIGLWIGLLISIFIIVSSCLTFAQESYYQAKATTPSIYNQQWQKSMAWVRENTEIGSVFVHWWDYGYWVQTIGQRPTVTDGGHPITYWDHLIGRYLLTTPKPETALSFMKTHNVSYLLIDSTDIGKYSAYSSIGNYEGKNDRISWIPTLLSDQSQIQETTTGINRIYQGGSYIDQDIIYKTENESIFLPANNAALVGIVSKTKEGNGTISFAQPEGVFVYRGEQKRMPIRYIYYDNKIIDFKIGLNATIIIIPSLLNSGESYQIDNLGAIVYLSERTMSSLVAKLYLMNDPFREYESITIAHKEQDSSIEFIKSQGANVGDFLYFNGLRGPITIWEVEYPENILTKEEFLRTSGKYGEFDNLSFIK